jgi:6-phosphogluconolactonase (cycloisomerase 2 family)
MTKTMRVLLSLLAVLATMSLANCGAGYSCGVTFGGSSCTPSGTGLGSGGGGTGGTGGGGGSVTPAAFAYNIVQTGTVNGIVYDNTHATLTNISGFSAPLVPTSDPSSELVTAQKNFLYGIFPVSNSLYAWSIDATTGDLTALVGSPYTVGSLDGMIVNATGVNLTSVVVNPSGTMLFVGEGVTGQILSYLIGTDGVLTPGATASTLGTVAPWNLAIDGLGKFLYVSEGIEGNGGHVAAYAINQGTGALTLVEPPFPFNIWELQGEPTGTFMIGISGNSQAITGITDNSIHVFAIQPSGATAGALSEVVGSPFATTYSPANIAVQPSIANGSFVYSFSLSATAYNPIEGFALNATTGVLTPITGSPFSGITASPWGQFDQSGDFLFVYGNLAASAPELSVLNVATGTGALTQPASTLPLATGGYFAVTDP